MRPGRSAARIVDVTASEFALLVPVKDGRAAKSRLGVGDDFQRAQLMAAFARDALTAACAVPGARVFVVGDRTALTEVVAGLDVTVLPDEGEGQLNRALERAARRLDRPDLGTAALLADLPCLRPDDLQAALADGSDRHFVADAAGTGTTLLVAPAGEDLDPHFGAGSAAAHLASGARALTAPLTSLRQDVDTTDDLEAALRFGVGVHTARVASSRL
jgi:2-phospho-L-lactate guanylyltransferase